MENEQLFRLSWLLIFCQNCSVQKLFLVKVTFLTRSVYCERVKLGSEYFDAFEPISDWAEKFYPLKLIILHSVEILKNPAHLFRFRFLHSGHILTCIDTDFGSDSKTNVHVYAQLFEPSIHAVSAISFPSSQKRWVSFCKFGRNSHPGSSQGVYSNNLFSVQLLLVSTVSE